MTTARSTERSRREQRLTDRGKVAAFKVAGSVGPYLPESVVEALSERITRKLRESKPERAMLVARHMRRALGPEAGDAEVAAAVDDVFASYSRYWIETFRLGGYSADRVNMIHELEGRENFYNALAEGGAIFALPHTGQWEVSGAWAGVQGFRVTAVAEKLEPAELFDWFLDLRERKFGMNIISNDDPAVTRKLFQAVADGDAVCLLSDRDLSRRGPEVEFFGEMTHMPVGPARLAIATGAPLIPAACFEVGNWRYRTVVRPPIPIPEAGTKQERVQEATQLMAYELEGLIRRAPSQWHVLQPNWPSDREALEAFRARQP